MKPPKSLAGTIFLVVFCNGALVASETLIVPATDVNGVWSSPLRQGQLYQFTASGTYSYGPGEDIADAEWIMGPSYVSGEYWTLPAAGGPFGESTDILDVCINDASVSWLGTADGITYSPHTYSSTTHIYEFYFTGTGDAVKFHIADEVPFGPNYMGDDSGYLTITITEVPEPSAWAMLVVGSIALMVYRRRK